MATKQIINCATGSVTTVDLDPSEITRREQETANMVDKLARLRRNELLAASDWTQAADAPVDQTAWATYRQQLRDLPTQPNWPDVTFPDPPEVN